MPVLIWFFLPLNLFWVNKTIAIIFLIIGLTDFFDGYIARTYKQETKLGKILDPVADKVLLISTILPLLYINKISVAVSLILVLREVIISSLRSHCSLSVSSVAKWKTFFQYGYLVLVLSCPWQNSISYFILNLEKIFLSCAISFSLWSAFEYCSSIQIDN